MHIKKIADPTDWDMFYNATNAHQPDTPATHYTAGIAVDGDAGGRDRSVGLAHATVAD